MNNLNFFGFLVVVCAVCMGILELFGILASEVMFIFLTIIVAAMIIIRFIVAPDHILGIPRRSICEGWHGAYVSRDVVEHGMTLVDLTVDRIKEGEMYKDIESETYRLHAGDFYTPFKPYVGKYCVAHVSKQRGLTKIELFEPGKEK